MAVVTIGREKALSGDAHKASPEISRQIDEFLSFMRQACEAHRSAIQYEKEMDDLTQDVLHYIELERPLRAARTRAVGLLEKARIDRRSAQNEIRLTEPISRWAAENAGCIKSLERLLGDVRKAEKSIQNRL